MFFKTIKTTVYIILVLVILYVFLRFFGSAGRPGIKFSLDQTSVVTKIQNLARLETSSFTIEKIIEGGREGNVFQNILYGDKILLIAHADVVAGFDVSKIKPQDVKIDGSDLYITVPAPEILYSRLDNEKTRVYDRKLGLFTKGDIDLESQARLTAEQSIRQAACDGGILNTATENGRKQFETMFMSAGFSTVTVSVPSVECK